MSASTRAQRIAAEADETVSGWMSISPGERAVLAASGVISKCKSGGYLVDVGEAFPVWRSDMGAVRRLLLDRDLVAAEVAAARSS